MKKTIIILIISLAAFGLGYLTGIVKKSVDDKFEVVTETIEASSQSGQEKFDDFIYKFISDSLFQLGRIKFPLKSQQWDSDQVDSTRIEKNNWKTVRLFWGDEYRPQIYDNFKREMRDTDERLFCWEGIENGINIEYRFSRIKGLWYLTEFNDFSD